MQFEEDVRLLFEKDSLALKTLQEGTLDFTDRRVKLKAASLEQAGSKLSSMNKKVDLLEVDLGELKSLSSD